MWAARSFDQTALRPSVIKRIRQIDVKIHNTYHKLRCHMRGKNACVELPKLIVPLNSYLYVHWILDFKTIIIILFLLVLKNYVLFFDSRLLYFYCGNIISL